VLVAMYFTGKVQYVVILHYGQGESFIVILKLNLVVRVSKIYTLFGSSAYNDQISVSTL